MPIPKRDDISERLQSFGGLHNIKNLQTQPTVIARITQMLQNPATTGEELGLAIRTDQGLTTRVLKLVNSAFYGFPGKIGSISHAVVLLGFSTVKNIVLTASVLDIFKTNSGGKFNARNVWKHSLACGVSAQCLARTIGYEFQEECFVAGLLHDIGKVVLFQLAPDDFSRVVECADKTKTLFYDAECKLLGINHQEIGGILIEQWRLPTKILSAVSSHHNPAAAEGDDSELTAIVHCADIFARALGYGNGGDRKIPSVSDMAWDTLKLDGVNLATLFDTIVNEWEKAGVYVQEM
jgi:putative nucleotidyltransferase with HDIG domain